VFAEIHPLGVRVFAGVPLVEQRDALAAPEGPRAEADNVAPPLRVHAPGRDPRAKAQVAAAAAAAALAAELSLAQGLGLCFWVLVGVGHV
jgi:hypothetical protein